MIRNKFIKIDRFGKYRILLRSSNASAYLILFLYHDMNLITNNILLIFTNKIFKIAYRNQIKL